MTRLLSPISLLDMFGGYIGTTDVFFLYIMFYNLGVNNFIFNI